MVITIVVVFFIVLLMGIPIGFCLGIAALAGIAFIGDPAYLNMISQRFYAGLDMFPLMAMPFFILAGDIMNKTGITHKIVYLANDLVGHFRGGLAHGNILTSILFAGMTGSAVSDTAAIGTMLIPAMEKDGYDKDFAAAVTAASSIIGPTIPPSTLMVVYGSIVGTSIGAMFAGGILPGLMIGLSLMIVAGIISKKRGYKKYPRPPIIKILKTFKTAFIPLLMPIIIIGGILSGAFTPTEAAAVAVCYAVFVGFFWLKTLSLKDIPGLLYNTAHTTGICFLIVGTGSMIAWLFTMEQVPQMIATVMLQISSSKFVFLALVLLMLLIVGMFMDIVAAMIILAPILHPVAVKFGIHPVHFGIIFVIALNIGLMTPPLGACLFVACGISGLKLEELSKAIIPFIIVEILILVLVAFVPSLILVIPRLLGLS
jgi:TRAP-type transport system large permease protein